MREVILILQFSALIPILVIWFYKPQLNLFYKLLFASILLSIIFDVLGAAFSYYFKNNILIYCIYHIFNTILITTMWQKIPFYSLMRKKVISIVGYSILSLMIVAIIYFGVTANAFYIVGSLSIALGLFLALYFYAQKLAMSSYIFPLKDPYFITASGIILFSLSQIIIVAALVQFEGSSFAPNIWLFRQVLYLIYNLIIGYAFYVLYKSQLLKK